MICRQDGHFPKHCHLETGNQRQSQESKKTFEQKWKRKVFPETNQDTRARGVARHGSCGRAGSRDSQAGVVSGQTGHLRRQLSLEAVAVGARGGSSVPPPRTPARLTTGHVRPLPRHRALAPLDCHRPTCQSPSCHKCHIPRKKTTVHLGKFTFSPLKPDSFKGSINSKGELDATARFLSNKLARGEQRRSRS